MQRQSRVYLVGCDAKSDSQLFSGITYHLAKQGVRDGLLSGMMNLYPRGIATWRVYIQAGWWKLNGGLPVRRGFKFTDAYLNGIWKRRLSQVWDAAIISNFQLFGSYFLSRHQRFGVSPYVYIDGTLKEYFEDYKAFDTAEIDEAVMNEAYAIEQDGYARCCKIVVMSKRTAASIVKHYGVSQRKIHVVPPGANIPEESLEIFENRAVPGRGPSRKSLVLGFVGLYPERKGLPLIAEAVRLSRRSGYDVRLHVIGKCPPEIAEQEGVTHFGVIDKSVDLSRFVGILQSVDVGCMLSHAELAGVALMEFLRVGIPIIATDVGGIPDILALGSGQLVSPDISAADLAMFLAGLSDDPERLYELRESAWRRRHNASWRRVVGELRDIVSQ
jgi:glycosyltransferase involved in cell wall biosynthesis